MTTNKQEKTIAPAATAAFAAKSQATDVLEASRNVAARAKAQPVAVNATVANDKQFADIKSNVFYQVMFDPALNLTAKKDAMAKALTFDTALSQEANENRIESFTVFSEWMQAKRKEMAIEMLTLNDTEAFAQLKDVIDQLGSGILDFNKKIEPFLSILDALYQMQLKGVKTSDMLDEIIKDREATERLNGKLETESQAARDAEDALQLMRDQVAEYQNQKSWYTLGTKIKPAAQAEIDKLSMRITQKSAEIGEIGTRVAAIQTELGTPRESQFADLAEAKQNLRVLLDISSDNHRSNQQALNLAAANFVKTSETQVGAVLVNIGAMNDRIEAAGKKSGKMIGMYAVMNDSIAEAMQANHGVLSGQAAPTDGSESQIESITREETRESVLKHIKTLTGTREATLKMYDGLSKEKAELAGMHDSNTQQISATRYLHGSGIANMAMQTNAMITALASAANGQSTKVAQELVDQMGESAMTIRAKDSLRAAIEFQGTNETLERVIQQAAQSAEMMRNTAAINAETLGRQRDLLAQVKGGAEDMQRAITEQLQVYANGEDAVANDNSRVASAPAVDDVAAFRMK